MFIYIYVYLTHDMDESSDESFEYIWIFQPLMTS